MEPVPFEQANKVLTKPIEFEGDCGELPVFTDGRVCLSVWQMTWLDRLQALLFGKVWLFVWSGETQPAVGMAVERSVFRLNKEVADGSPNDSQSQHSGSA